MTRETESHCLAKGCVHIFHLLPAGLFTGVGAGPPKPKPEPRRTSQEKFKSTFYGTTQDTVMVYESLGQMLRGHLQRELDKCHRSRGKGAAHLLAAQEGPFLRNPSRSRTGILLPHILFVQLCGILGFPHLGVSYLAACSLA